MLENTSFKWLLVLICIPLFITYLYINYAVPRINEKHEIYSNNNIRNIISKLENDKKYHSIIFIHESYYDCGGREDRHWGYYFAALDKNENTKKILVCTTDKKDEYKLNELF